ncbi:NAD-dependent glycerol-3-phosphate dehydrogenase [Hamiltosporidium tvaerminnensis]|uniref:Glycerol-3-phosphate dehydrogenase [NAD(+)] n=1 Tax=Hamiltosporidium tvaerminnensis TaxID=1176355 RepID=A0A4Q9M3F1_9MICR|nr:NAD-dependent glycerol-3-phosphate dehydrogenase [Hamiltosporidium tvaerminnensis]
MQFKVSIVGGGNFGTAIAKLLAENVLNLKSYSPEITMWLYEEYINEIPLTQIINTTHINTKYLPDIHLPTNIRATSDLKELNDSDILIFVIPHQFVKNIINQIKGTLKKGVISVSLIKGVIYSNGDIGLISKYISNTLNIPCGVLMGANIAIEVAKGYISEGTLSGVNDKEGIIIRNLFNSNIYRVSIVDDLWGVELCGTLKNVVSLGYGICKGMGCGLNTCCAVLRNGLVEICNFYKLLGKGKDCTLFESCGISDLMVSCLAGRNFKAGEFIGKKISLEEIKEKMGGQQLQGPDTAKEIYEYLKGKGKENEFPLFTTVYRVCFENELPDAIYCCISPKSISDQ